MADERWKRVEDAVASLRNRGGFWVDIAAEAERDLAALRREHEALERAARDYRKAERTYNRALEDERRNPRVDPDIVGRLLLRLAAARDAMDAALASLAAHDAAVEEVEVP